MIDADEMISCEMCGGEFAWEEALLGILGRKLHFRCPCCGWQWDDDTIGGDA